MKPNFRWGLIFFVILLMLIIVILIHILVEKSVACCNWLNDENEHSENPEIDESSQVENEEIGENGPVENEETPLEEEIHLANNAFIFYTFIFSLLLSMLLYFPSQKFSIRMKLLFRDFSGLLVHPIFVIALYFKNHHIWNFVHQKIPKFRKSSVQPQINTVEIEMIEMNHFP